MRPSFASIGIGRSASTRETEDAAGLNAAPTFRARDRTMWTHP